MRTKTNILILLVLLGALITILPGSKNACAADLGVDIPDGDHGGGGGGGTIAKQTCDTQVWQTMAARAQLETEREIMQNQNLIFKADSVLDYVCFDNFAAHAAKNVGVLFTHTTYFGNSSIIQMGSIYGMDVAMQNVVMNSMGPYLNGNFAHELLGGRGKKLGVNRRELQQIGPRDYSSCDVMNKVWMAAKCANFLHTQDFAATDGFYPFINLTPTAGGQAVEGYETKNDIRKYPTACSGGTPILGSTWKEKYRDSRNETDFGVESGLYVFQSALLQTFSEVRKRVKPITSGACPIGIKTGIKVILGPNDSSPYDDGVCTNPGCSYYRNGTCSTDGSTTSAIQPNENGEIIGGTGGAGL